MLWFLNFKKKKKKEKKKKNKQKKTKKSKFKFRRGSGAFLDLVFIFFKFQTWAVRVPFELQEQDFLKPKPCSKGKIKQKRSRLLWLIQDRPQTCVVKLH